MSTKINNLLWRYATRTEQQTSKRIAQILAMPVTAALEKILLEKYPAIPLMELLQQRQVHEAQREALRQAKREESKRAYQEKLNARYQTHASWSAWFDGSAHPNLGRCGIGALLQSPQGQRWQASRAIGYGNSSMAEYQALILALEMALREGAEDVVIFGDSRVVLDDVQMVEGGAVSLTEWRHSAQTLLRQIPKARLQWIPRARNHIADALSQAAVVAVVAVGHE